MALSYNRLHLHAGQISYDFCFEGGRDLGCCFVGELGYVYTPAILDDVCRRLDKRMQLSLDPVVSWGRTLHGFRLLVYRRALE